MIAENYTRCEWACLHSSGYALEYTHGTQTVSEVYM